LDGSLKDEKQLSRKNKEKLKSIKILERPNTHRLVEYYMEQHLAWRHAMWTGELSLERTHQRVKQSLKKTNGQEEHILAVNASRFNDWQGRLRSVVIQRDDTHMIHMRESIGLLAGRGRSQLVDAQIPLPVRMKIGNMLHPEGLVMGEIRLQGQLVFGKHGFLCGKRESRVIRRCTKGAKICVHKVDVYETKREELWADLFPGMNFDEKTLMTRVRYECKCGMRRGVVNSGDLIQDVDTDGTVLYWQIIMFVRDTITGTPNIVVVRRCEDNGSSGRVRVCLPYIYRRRDLTERDTFVPTSSDCRRMGCGIDKARGELNHDMGSRPQFILLNKNRAFPPRQG